MKTQQDDEIDDGIEYEEVSEDDTVIGRAFRVSIAVLVVGGAAVGGTLWWLNRPKETPPPTQAPVSAPQVVHEEAVTPSVVFTDVTEVSGIDFVHENGAHGGKFLPETMGGGSAFLDHDQDGDADLLFVNSSSWPEDDAPGELATMRLFNNDGKGSFSDVTQANGLAVSFYGMSVACGDADCEGDVDLFFTALGPNRFFRRGDAGYEEADVGVRGADESWSTCAAFFDADKDGDLDLYVGNYVKWSRDIDLEVNYQLTGVGRAYGPPTNYEGAHPYFYRNEGDGTFVDRSVEAGFQLVNRATGVPVAKTLGVRPTDADLDGDIDLMVANDTVANCFFENDGQGTFVDKGAAYALAYDREGRARGAMGVDAAWYRNDGALGIAIGNFANEMTSFFVSQEGKNLYLDEAIPEGIGAPSRKFLKFGVVFLDYDLDGREDLLEANGHLENEIQVVQASQTYAQPAQLFWNAGSDRRSTYVEVKRETLGDLCKPVVGRGLSYADIDGDGDLDVLITQVGGKSMLLRNDQALGHHWIRLKLEQEGCNPDAYGARVELTSASVTQRREVMPTRSYLSQVELPLTFGLGTETKVERVKVFWPDGTEQEFPGLEIDRLHVLRR